jgi:hypothetical protein
MKPESAGQALTDAGTTFRECSAAALFGVLAFSLFGDTHVRRTGCDHSARVSQSTNRNQDTGNQGQHYAQDHEVP